MTRRQDLAALAELAAMLRDRDLARLAGAMRRAAGIAQEIEAVEDELRQRGKEVAAAEMPDTAWRAGADTPWQEFAGRRRSELTAGLANARAAAEDIRSDAVRSLGRAEALARLARR